MLAPVRVAFTRTIRTDFPTWNVERSKLLRLLQYGLVLMFIYSSVVASWWCCGTRYTSVECGDSTVERLTRNQDLAFSFSPRHPSSLGCINECLAIDRGGNMTE